MQHKCWVCESTFEKYDSLRRHVGRAHKIHSSEVYVKVNLDGVYPICACGCGEKLPWTNKGFLKYIRGHASRVNNNWGHNPKAVQNSTDTRREQYKSGLRTVWNKGLTKEDPRVLKYIVGMNTEERSKKISETTKGKKKTGKALIASRNNILNFHKSNPKYSGLENKFEFILDKLGVKYEKQKQLVYGTFGVRIYDFCIPSKNILIEVDGDYWHCNPSIFQDGPINKTQTENIINDALKEKLAKIRGYTLIRFWEQDIVDTPNAIFDDLYEKIK